MASSKERQRKLARAKLDRQMARRAASRRRSRQVKAGVGAGLALLLIFFGSYWLLGGFDKTKETPTAEGSTCAWTPRTGEDAKDTGTPPTSGAPNLGTRPLTMTTSQGTIAVTLDLVNSACAAASFTHLTGRTFFDNTKCHELTTEGALRCGDPSGTGRGGPTYGFPAENLPIGGAAGPSSPAPGATVAPTYRRGQVALVAASPGVYSSQFLIFSRNLTVAQPAYSIVGQVSAGLDVIDKIVKAGTVDNGSGQKIKPKTDVVVQSMTVGEVAVAADPGAQTPAPTPPASPAPTPTRS